MAIAYELGHTTLTGQQKLTLAKQSKHTESEVKEELRDVLHPHFIIQEEVRGTGPTGEKVKIDFMCFPKPMTIDKGWPARYFGIEAKGYGDQDQRKKTATRIVYQATIYRLSQFPAGGVNTYPNLVLLYPCLSLFMEGSDDDPAFLEGFVFALAKEAGMFRVGELVLKGKEFEVYFHGINRWFHSKWGKNRADCLGKDNNHASR